MRKPPERRRLRVVIAVALLTIGTARFLPLLAGQVLITSLTPLCDQWHVNMPFAFLLAEALREGRLPVWTDRIGGGYPLLALGEAGVLYPPHLLLYRLLPPVTAYNVNVILAVLTAAACQYWLCRDLGRSRAASLLGGLAYAWSGFFVLHVATLHSAQAAAWIPLLLLCVRRGARAATPASWIGAGVVLAIQITTGYPQIVYYSALAAAFLAIWELGWGEDRGAPGGPAGKVVNGVGGALVVLAVALGLSAAHWLPGVELTRQSGRSGGISFERATEFSFPPANLLTFVAPYVHGNPATGGEMGFSERGHFWDNGYVGLIPLFLALYAAAYGLRRKGPIRFFVFLLLFSLLIVLGRHTPFFRVVWHVLPGMSYFRFPSRFMVIACLSLALLAAYGLDQLRARLLAAPGRDSRRRWAVLAGMLFAISFVDLWIYAARFHRFADAAAWLTPPKSARFLQTVASPSARYYAFGYAGVQLEATRRARGWKGDLGPYLEQKEVLAPNTGAFYGLSCFNFFGGLDTRRGTATYALLCDDRNTLGRTSTILESFPRTLALLGVTHVVTPYLLAIPGLREEMAVKTGNSKQPVRVYAVEDARPQIWIPDQARSVAGGREAFRTLLEARWSAIEGAPEFRNFSGEVLAWEAGPDWARARIRMRGTGVVIHNQRHYPGWRVLLDGEPAPLLRANYLMQGVAVPEGEHTLEFRFDSPSFRAGATISLLSMALLAAGCILTRLRGKR
ncbi:MAG: YfhO family protein [Armatimonadetes bacterium]|nr:YfhO family protein [Armatimonadota bacterium]